MTAPRPRPTMHVSRRGTGPRTLRAMAVLTGFVLMLGGSAVATTERVSVGAGAGNGGSFLRSGISGTGRYVVFASAADNLVLGDTNGVSDVFVRDRQSGITTRVSVDSEGGEGDGASNQPAVSASGRYVVFESDATNLVPGDTNGEIDVFVHDRKTGVTTRVSVGSQGTEGNATSSAAVISANGRYVAFQSVASNLVAVDGNGVNDVFVHDRKTGVTERLSVNPQGAQGNGASSNPSISASGRYVAFTTVATNLVPQDGNNTSDVIIHDRKKSEKIRVSVSANGGGANGPSSQPSISSSGRYVAFRSGATNIVAEAGKMTTDIFVRDVKKEETTWVSVDSEGVGHGPDFASLLPSLSGNGRYVAFQSDADLVEGDDNDMADVFVHDRKTRITTRASVASGGESGDSSSVQPAFSAGGRHIAFVSLAANLVPGDDNGLTDVFVHDRQSSDTDLASSASVGSEGNAQSSAAAVSADGRWVAFASNASNLVVGDGNATSDIFVHDRKTRATTRVSVATSGVEGDDFSAQQPAISSNGRYVAFTSLAGNLVPGDDNETTDVFVHDTKTGVTERVSVSSAGAQGDGASGQPALSADGRHVAFRSLASNLVTGDGNGTGDIFVHDRKTGETTRVSVDSSGAEGDGDSERPVLSANGRWVAFRSTAADLVEGDGNGVADIFVHDRNTGETTRVSVDASGNEGDGAAQQAAITPNGRWVAFASEATNLVESDGNGVSDVFVHDRKTGETIRVSRAADGSEGGGASTRPTLSANGKSVAFVSSADDLVDGDGNGVSDIFVRDLAKQLTVRVSVDADGIEADGASDVPVMAANGKLVVFQSEATALVPDDTNAALDVFARDL